MSTTTTPTTTRALPGAILRTPRAGRRVAAVTAALATIALAATMLRTTEATPAIDTLRADAAALAGASFGLDPADLPEITGLAFPVVVHGPWRSIDGIVWTHDDGTTRAFGWDPAPSDPDTTGPAGTGG